MPGYWFPAPQFEPPGYWSSAPQSEPPTFVPFSNVANPASARFSDHGLAPSHVAPNGHGGFDHSLADTSANMSERFMDLPIPPDVANDDTIPLHYDLRDFAVVDAEIGDPSWLRMFELYRLGIEMVFEVSLSEPAYDEALVDLGLVDRIGTDGNRAAVTKRPYNARHRLILQLVEEIKRLKQNSWQSGMRERVLKQENEIIGEELKAARSMHKNLIQQLRENDRAKTPKQFSDRENGRNHEELRQLNR
ncbi:hypothetical protein G7Y79_00025g057080 [Physcia stellaris]|nr:hypothetical protein G7Y79_00025g057080 [Physcia stellaris]